MTLNDIIEAYNDAERTSDEHYPGHYIIAKTIIPKPLGAYKEFKITLYFHTPRGNNLESWSISETFKASSTDAIKSCWGIMEKKALVKFIKWCKGWS